MKLFLLLALISIFLINSTLSQNEANFETSATNSHSAPPHH